MATSQTVWLTVTKLEKRWLPFYLAIAMAKHIAKAFLSWSPEWLDSSVLSDYLIVKKMLTSRLHFWTEFIQSIVQVINKQARQLSF